MLAASDSRAVRELASRLLAELDSPNARPRRAATDRRPHAEPNGCMHCSCSSNAQSLAGRTAADVRRRAGRGPLVPRRRRSTKFLKRIEADWLAALPEPLRARAARLLARPGVRRRSEAGAAERARPFMREWKFDELAQLIAANAPHARRSPHREASRCSACRRCHRVGRHGAAGSAPI